MNQKKYTSKGKTFYEVTFLGNETDHFPDEKPTTHTATIFYNGFRCFCIRIDGKLANSLGYSTPKAALKNSWIIDTKPSLRCLR